MDDSTWANSDKVASKETLFRIWSLVGKDKAPLAQLLGRIPGAEHLQIIEKSFSPDNFDFSIIDLDAEQMFRFTKGVEYSSVVDHEQTWLPFLRFVTACQLWLYQTSEETKGRGTHNVLRTMVSDILLRQMNVRQDVGLPPLDMDMIGQLLILYQNGYSDVLNFAFARSGIDDLVTISRKTGLNLFQGNLQDTIQERAFLALIYTLDSTPISKEIVNKVSQKFEKAGAINTSFYVRLIIEGGANSSLPDEIITSLISQAKSSLGTKEKGFKDIELGRMLAFSLRQMNTEQQTITYEFIEALASNEQTLFSSMMAQIYGTLAEQNLDSPEMLVRVRAKVKATKMKYGSTTASSEKQPGITITSPNDDWILSLASFAASRELNADDRDLLISHIEHPELGITITRALAVHNLEASKYQSINDILFMLQREDNSAKSRREVEELSIIFLAKLNIDSFTIAIQELIDARENSIEPQTRASIGKIIIESTLERSRTLGTGLRLRV